MTPENILSIVTLHTPVIQAALLYAYYYRGEPLRILHPLREKTSRNAWIDVLTQLGLVKEKVKKTHQNRKRELAGSLIALMMPTTLLSLLSADLLGPFLLEIFPLLTKFESVLLFLIQLIPAAYFFILVQKNYLGPPKL
jgi:hypothetical protein